MMRDPLPFGTYAPGPLTRFVLMLSQHTPLGRGKARKMMAACVRKLNSEKLDTVLFGQNVRLHMQNNSSEIKALMKPSQYSKSEFSFCAKHLPYKDRVFVDIGANAGLFSLGVARYMSGGILIAAEPQPRLFERLKLNIEDFNSERERRPEVHLFKTALGPLVGELSLSVPDQLGQASARKLQGAEQINVSVIPLLDMLSTVRVDCVDLLKIDVEGFEDEVLMPFFKTAPKTLWPRAIVLEHCHKDRWQSDCHDALIDLGYRIERKDRTNWMFVLETR